MIATEQLQDGSKFWFCGLNVKIVTLNERYGAVLPCGATCMYFTRTFQSLDEIILCDYSNGNS